MKITMTPKQFCANYNACSDGAEFAGKFETMAEVWDVCPRADWLLWILEKLEIRDDKKLRLFACWCVRNTKLASGRMVWDLLTDDRSRKAVEVAEAFARGEATQSDLNDAREAAWAAWAAAGEAAGAAWAAWAAAGEAAWAAGAAAGEAAWDAAWDAARAADWAAGEAACKQQADHLRTVFANPFLEEASK